MGNEIYFDNSATTRISEEALKTYLSVARSEYGNPSSLHGMGKDAETVLKNARQTIAKTVGDTAGGTVLFTSGGTEANNLAIFGRAHAKPRFKGKTILTSAGEHASVKMPLAALADEGYKIVEIPTTGGRLDPEAIVKYATPDVILASIMLVNNETGALYDVPAVAAALRRSCPDAVLHVDATQAYLKVPFSVKTLGCGLLTLSSHKIEGPKGTGALWIDPGVIRNRGLVPILLGGGQEAGLRSGTEDPPSCAAFAKAAAVGYSALAERIARLTELRERLFEKLASNPFLSLSGVRANLPPVASPHIVSLTIPHFKSETMLHALSARGIYVSSGSACSSHGKHGTSALSAFGLSDADADATIRVSFSHRNTVEQIDLFCDALSEEITRLVRF
ncbi:MAG: cysteine desulfurase [Clostridia bacterium]|nr:cysteine desulfurase [Clostridia bacterium]